MYPSTLPSSSVFFKQSPCYIQYNVNYKYPLYLFLICNKNLEFHQDLVYCGCWLQAVVKYNFQISNELLLEYRVARQK